MKQRRKRHHYLPEAYLKAWADKGRQVVDREELAQLRLRRVRPALRFNTGPLLEPDATGRLVPAGQEILHAFVPYGDDVG